MSKLLRFSSDNTADDRRMSEIEPWQVLVVDDDEAIHDVTKLILNDFYFDDRPLQLTHAYCGEQARLLLQKPNQYAVMLLDVVMETEHSGLDLVNFIRSDLDNHFLRIVLRTGQPGQAPEVNVMANYDINDYRDKTDLTADKMRTCLTAALRSYKDINTIRTLVSTKDRLSQKVHKRNQELTLVNEQLKAEIDTRCAVEKELSFTNDKLESIINNSEAVISLKNPDGRYDMVNQAFVERLAVKCNDIIGKFDTELFDEDISMTLLYNDQQVLEKRKSIQVEELLPTHDGEHFHLCVKFPLFDDNNEIYRICTISTDITDRLDAQNELLRLSQYDALTDLPNRTLFIDRVAQVISRTQWRDNHVALMFLDVDRFKQINDTLGHHIGDKLLIEVAKRLQQSTREGDTVSRMGGDEFALLLTDLASENDIIRVINKITENLTKPYFIENRELIVTCSIGVARCPIDGNDIQSLLKKADVAMYKAKKAGRNTYRFYLKEDDCRANEQLSLELDLRNMLAQMNEQLFLQYQPKINLSNGKTEGFEALLRWRHPTRGIISPAEFIPVLEETGMIVDIGPWILTQACQFAVDHNLHNPPIKVAVNLSSRQFKQVNLVESVEQILRQTECNPHWIELEVTEGSLVDDLERTCETLKAFAKMGISLAIDDFGTGYSSLNYLKKLPFHTLKIDKSFIDNAPEIRQEKAIVTTIAQLANNLEMQVVAEGVETLLQYQMLKELVSNSLSIQIQGYIFSKPLNVCEINPFLKDINSRWQDIHYDRS